MSEVIFRTTDDTAGLRWILACAAMAAVIAAGWMLNQLTACSLLLIVSFTIVRGVVPYFASTNHVAKDQGLCQEERSALVSTAAADSAELLSVDTTTAGSVFKLGSQIVAAGKHSDQAVRAFFAAFDSYWSKRLAPMQDAADQAPVLGLAGSLIGIADAIQSLANGNDNENLYSSLAVMALTTLCGGAAYILISGLARDAEGRVAQHRSDLQHVAGFFGNTDPGTNDDSTETSLNPLEFGRRRK